MNDDDDRSNENELLRRSLTEAGFTEDQMTVVYLRINKGMSSQAIAEELQWDLATVQRLDDEAQELVQAARKRIADEQRSADDLRTRCSSTRRH